MNSKKLLAKKSTKGVRYWKNVGLGFKTPKEAIEGNYIDKKCPFTGNVSIRGRIVKYQLKSILIKKRHGYINQNGQNMCYKKKLFALCSQIQTFWEKT